MEDKKLTGYPTIDMPHQKYFRERPLRNFDVNQKIYSLILDANKSNLDYKAIGYMGKNITYKELFNDVKKYISAFDSLGVKKGDVVPILTTNTPEVAKILLALNYIGAISKWVDLRSSENGLIHYFNEHNCKVCICFDKIIKNVEDIISKTNLETVIVNKPVDSLDKIKNIGYDIMMNLREKTSVIPKDKRFITFKEFENLGKNLNNEFKLASYDKEEPSLIVQSSGTTGVSKSIIHTDYSVNNSFKEWSYTDFPLYPGNSLLVTVPPFVAYGLVGSYF